MATNASTHDDGNVMAVWDTEKDACDQGLTPIMQLSPRELSTYTQQDNCVAVLPNTNTVVVAWDIHGSYDGEGRGILTTFTFSYDDNVGFVGRDLYGQRHFANGPKLYDSTTLEFQINSNGTGVQWDASLADSATVTDL